MRIFETYPTLDKLAIIRSADKENVIRFISDACISERGFAAGEEIISPDMIDIPVGFLLEGSATVGSADDGKRVLIRTVSAGAVFGVATLYSADQPFPTKIRAKSPCRVLFIASSAMKALIENDHGANKEFLTFLGNRIVYLNKKINAFTAGSAERRLAYFLDSSLSDHPQAKGEPPEITVQMNSLCEMLNLGRASLYRAADKLCEEGLIRREGKKIIVLDRGAMMEKYR